jgi:hypothetical protein
MGTAKRGRPPTDDGRYLALLEAWEEDEATRPNLLVKVRISHFLRRDVPKSLGLKIGDTRTRGGDGQTALLDALARGRWVRARQQLEFAARRRRTSLLDAGQTITVRTDSGSGLTKLVPKVPSRYKGR